MIWRAEPVNHKGKAPMAVYFAPGKQAAARQPEGGQWSRTLKVWHLPDTAENRTRFRIPVQAKAGHNSSRTIEIYTHVSKRAIGQIKSYLMICEKNIKGRPIAEIPPKSDGFSQFICGNKQIVRQATIH